MFKFYHKNYIINNKCMESSNKYHKICPNRDIWINYHILLGEGGFGKVYKGKDATKNILVAIKVLPRSQDKQKLAKKEFSYACKVNHKNIIKYYDIISDQHNLYIIMQLAGGGSLDKFILKYREQGKRLEGLPEKVVFSLFQQLLDGMINLQQHDIVHRDIKPSNILLDETEKIIKIADFGQAIDYSLMETLDQGTPLYMAPQVLNPKGRKSQKNKRSDVWSLGLVLYEMLTCKKLFEKQIKGMQSYSEFQRFMKQKQKYNFMEPPFPQYLEEEWSQIRKKMLVYNVEERSYFQDIILKLNFTLEQKLQHKYIGIQKQKSLNSTSLEKKLSQIIRPQRSLIVTQNDQSIVKKAEFYLQFFKEKHLIFTKLFIYFQSYKYCFISHLQKYLLTFLTYKAYLQVTDKMIKNLHNQIISSKTQGIEFCVFDLKEPFQGHLRRIFQLYRMFYQEQKKIYKEIIQEKLLPKIQKQSEEVKHKYPQIHKFIAEEHMQHEAESYTVIFGKYFEKFVLQKFENLEKYYPLNALKVYFIMIIIYKNEIFFNSHDYHHGSVYIQKLYENLVNWKKKKDRQDILKYIKKLNF